MGIGKKAQPFPLKGKPEIPWSVDWSPPARNLRKDQLGAVIFGCRNHTITECLRNGIFGLPASHYSYVKNITPGFTIYLFNYSDRTLHGIFGAVSPGQMNFSPNASINSEGSQDTPYPAQLRVRQQKKCRPLPEQEFKPIIKKNYYSDKLFWFELDKEQNLTLIKLFLSSPLPESIPPHVLSRLNVTETANKLIKILDSSITECYDMELEFALSSKEKSMSPRHADMDPQYVIDKLKRETEELKVSLMKQRVKIEILEHELLKAKHI